MPERPLVLFAAPTVADKERRYGVHPNIIFHHIHDRYQDYHLSFTCYRIQ